MFDVIVVGAGFAGSVLACEMAKKNKKILVLEKRSQIGGNMYEYKDSNGIPIHKYGPHIFHTNNKEVFEYLKQFSEFFKYEHKVLGKIDGEYVPVPFNFTSLEKLFPRDEAKEIESKLLSKYEKEAKVSILELINDSDSQIKKFGEYVYEKVFIHYTAKQWEIPIEEVDTSVINRVPVILGYDDRYFQDKYQFMPNDGFTIIFENMLNNKNITLELNQNATDRIKIDTIENKVYFDGKEYNGLVIYTGAIDELLEYKYGELPYRSINLVFEQYKEKSFQPSSVVNYPNEEKFTRITEFKKFYPFDKELQNKNDTTILKEYPIMYKKELDLTPYYVITNKENLDKYQKYIDSVKNIKNLYFCGRLAEYKYYNMDAVIERALNLINEIEGME